jgi:hypothetical protein
MSIPRSRIEFEKSRHSPAELARVSLAIIELLEIASEPVVIDDLYRRVLVAADSTVSFSLMKDLLWDEIDKGLVDITSDRKIALAPPANR